MLIKKLRKSHPKEASKHEADKEFLKSCFNDIKTIILPSNRTDVVDILMKNIREVEEMFKRHIDQIKEKNIVDTDKVEFIILVHIS
jgi:uncharacterized protein YfcZ (UPF0381/DUF406 family)